jgi:hypothetical protein
MKQFFIIVLKNQATFEKKKQDAIRKKPHHNIHKLETYDNDNVKKTRRQKETRIRIIFEN